MSEKFKAIVINNQNENFSREIKDISSSELKDGNVLVKVDYSSLNYKDAMILKDGGRIVRKFPFVPGIDFSGTVVESEDDKFKKNDNVILTGFRVGEAYFGGFSQYARVDSNFLIKLKVFDRYFQSQAPNLHNVSFFSKPRSLISFSIIPSSPFCE